MLHRVKTSLRLIHSPLLALSFIACGAEDDFATTDLEQTRAAAAGAAVLAASSAPPGIQVSSNLDPLAAGLGLSLSSSSDPTQQWYTEGVDGFNPALGAVQKLTLGSNSQQTYPRKMMFGDFDGDRKADLLQWYRGRLLITRLDFERSELAHLFLPFYFDRVIVGDFIGAGWDQVCVIENSLHCYGIDPAQDDQLRFWFKSANPISSLEEVIVGNFDGDPAEELFLYQRETGAMRMLERSGENFTTHQNWTRGNLSRVASAGIQFRAGDLNGDGRTDLVARKTNGALEFFGSSVPSPGQNTFWVHYNTVSNFVAASDRFFLARVDDDMKSELVVHNPTTGAIRAHAVSQPAASPPEIQHQLNTKTRVSSNTTLAMAPSHPFRNEAGAQTRDDVFTHDADSDILYNYEARHIAGEGLTYRLDYSTLAPQNDQHWASRDERKVLFIKCQFQGSTATPHDVLWPQVFERVQDYLYEVSFGRVDLSASELDLNWHQLPMTRAELIAQAADEDVSQRSVGIRECLRATGKNRADYTGIFVLLNEGIDYGASGSSVLLTPNHFNVWLAAHELGHTLGLRDAWAVKAGKYRDPYDTMSAETSGFTHQTPFGNVEGPGFNAIKLYQLGAFPDYKYLTLDENSPEQTIKLSALNRPGGRVLIVEGEDSAETEYMLEYREPSGFDVNIPNPTVLLYVKRDLDDTDTGTGHATRERMPGERVTFGDLGTIDIVSFDTTKHLAELRFIPSN